MLAHFLKKKSIKLDHLFIQLLICFLFKVDTRRPYVKVVVLFSEYKANQEQYKYRSLFNFSFQRKRHDRQWIVHCRI